MSSIDAAEFNKIWKGPVIRIGIITVIVPTFMCFLPSLYLYMVHGVFPSFEVAMKAWGMVAATFGAFYVVEPISYYPILGLTGTYISFLSGNISNLRVPCAAVAQDVVGTEPGTPESEIVATLGLAGSVVTNLFFVSLAAVAGAIILEALPTALQNAFKSYTVPAIFGAMLGQFGVKMPILVPVCLIIPLFLLYVAPRIGLAALSAPWIVIVASIFGTILISRAFFKMKLVG
ncbi:MAG: hypothetical protein LBQ90_03265 [Synergistaceae bacterium]|jgi:hypothetical protein|nr:hypothetical protein [Synergistaceae bacterium]